MELLTGDLRGHPSSRATTRHFVGDGFTIVFNNSVGRLMYDIEDGTAWFDMNETSCKSLFEPDEEYGAVLEEEIQLPIKTVGRSVYVIGTKNQEAMQFSPVTVWYEGELYTINRRHTSFPADPLLGEGTDIEDGVYVEHIPSGKSQVVPSSVVDEPWEQGTLVSANVVHE